ncbi:tyrosine--tRNA ligase, partial [Patescibacteria group bacterium]|nr:tyrosine--tRNA ligase [Patescibacteria group bacterium]
MGTSDKIEDLLNRNVEKIISKKHLFDLLKSKKKLRIKHGIDPTGPKIHLGRAIPLRKLKSFQDLGHQVVIIIGDFTAQIGDASDKHAMRQVLSEKQVKRNMKDYTKQIGKILDMDKVELRYNSEWLGKLSAKDLINLAMRFTAQQMIERRNFKERWDENKPIGFHELNYPLLQGYDSVAIKADVEIGGSDQLFNLGVGRVIQKMFSQKPQDVMLLKMLSGLDGRKMATSWGNIITIVDKSSDMYGKVMSIKDELITEYFEF